MSDLTDFLLARIADDEAEARAPGVAAVAAAQGLVAFDIDDDLRAVVVAPSRVLAECEAKRLLVEANRQFLEKWPRPMWFDPSADYSPERPYVLRCLASVYADHPDYDASWRP